MTLNSEDVVPLLLQACPSALSPWEKELEYWAGDVRGDYNDMSFFARHIVNAFSNSQYGEFPEFFGLVERLIVEGNDGVRGLAVVGLLESIRNISSHQSFSHAPIEALLQPRSREAWEEIEATWHGKRTLADVIRAEKRNA